MSPSDRTVPTTAPPSTSVGPRSATIAERTPRAHAFFWSTLIAAAGVSIAGNAAQAVLHTAASPAVHEQLRREQRIGSWRPDVEVDGGRSECISELALERELLGPLPSLRLEIGARESLGHRKRGSLEPVGRGRSPERWTELAAYLRQIRRGRDRRAAIDPIPPDFPPGQRTLPGFGMDPAVVFDLDPGREQAVQLEQGGPVVHAGLGDLLGGGVGNLDQELIPALDNMAGTFEAFADS